MIIMCVTRYASMCARSQSRTKNSLVIRNAHAAASAHGINSTGASHALSASTTASVPPPIPRSSASEIHPRGTGSSGR